MAELFRRRFSIWILKALATGILCHSLDFNSLCMIQEYLSNTFELSTNWLAGSNFWGKAILQNGWIILSHLLYFNFKSFLGLKSVQFIRFECALHGSRLLFSESWNIYKLKIGGGPNLWGEPILQNASII